MTTAQSRIRVHWVEYGLEAWALGLFMVSACGFGVLLFHPGSPVVGVIPSSGLRRLLMGAAMGLTNVVNVYSPWGRRSGAHANPAVTLAFYRLGKVTRTDAIGYAGFQFIGGILGTYVGASLFSRWIADPSVNYVATVPGRWGIAAAFLAELAITFTLLCVVLFFVARPKLARFAGVAASLLVCAYITLETPISGMSMNPARTLASAIPSATWTALWIYFVAPPLGMLAAAELHRWVLSHRHQLCAKLHHDPKYPCIFCGHRP